MGNTVGSLSEVQRQIIVGSLLGDGAMRCKTNALLEINHSFHQRGYVDWKYRHLADLVRTPPKARRSNGTRIAYRFVTRSLSELTPYFRLFYGTGRKRIPELELSELTLAVWFMDDGCRSRNAVYLNTQQYDEVSQSMVLRTPPRTVGDRRSAESGQELLPSPAIGGRDPKARKAHRAASVVRPQIQTSASDPVTTEAARPRWCSCSTGANLWTPQHADPSPLVCAGCRYSLRRR